MNDDKKDSGVQEDDTALAARKGTEPSESEEKRGPLSLDEFRSVMNRIDDLGLTWTADIPPRLRLKGEETLKLYSRDAYLAIQKEYPSFPEELGTVIYGTLTGSKDAQRLIGNQQDAEGKIEIVKQLIATPEFRAEFFFKYAIKVPYFSDLDWEIVIKTFERNVVDMPRIPYALLSLVFQQPTSPGVPEDMMSEIVPPERMTVAVNEVLIDKLIGSLKEVRDKLRKSVQLAQSWDNHSGEDKENGRES